MPTLSSRRFLAHLQLPYDDPLKPPGFNPSRHSVRADERDNDHGGRAHRSKTCRDKINLDFQLTPNCSAQAFFPLTSLKLALLELNSSPYLERGRANHPASSKGKSYPCAMAVRYFLAMVLAMKTDASRRATKEVEPYVQLQRQMHEALLREHPEWVEPNGECPMCEAYESRLAQLLGLSSPREHRSAA
jgi:hypothetical protein